MRWMWTLGFVWMVAACGGKKPEPAPTLAPVPAPTAPAPAPADVTQASDAAPTPGDATIANPDAAPADATAAADAAPATADAATATGDAAPATGDASAASGDAAPAGDVTLTKSGFNPEGPPPKAWKDMGDDDKVAYMKEVVMPKMKPMFEGFDPREFAKVTCATCHGPSGKDNGMKMPTAEIYKLPGSDDAAGWEKEQKKHKRELEFMAMQVKPTMARLLGIEEYNHETKTGEFGCMHCHTTKQ